MTSTNKMGLTPIEIVSELDRFIVGQIAAKKAVALALRNRYRRMCLEEPMKSEIVPKNILMIGPTGVGKTEIARRLAALSDAPFIKVEATKFTEVGYVGRDVESIIRDLIENAVSFYTKQAKKVILKKAKNNAIDRILDALVGESSTPDIREKFRRKIVSGELDKTEVEIAVKDISAKSSNLDIPGISSSSMRVFNIGDVLGKVLGNQKIQNKKLCVDEALIIVTAEESDKMIDEERIIRQSINAVENDGVVFLDEIDKISCKAESRSGEVSREGVQRDLLPLIEGTNVNTQYGIIKTDHILFIASGAFHVSKPSDLLPELQGRLPIRVEMKPLSKKDLINILTEPESSLLKQYKSLMSTEGLDVSFSDEAVEEIAKYAADFNKNIEDIGARRLHTILEKLFEDLSFNASALSDKNITIDSKFVKEHLDDFVCNIDLAKFIL